MANREMMRWRRLIASRPDDWGQRLAFSDWLEEQGMLLEAEGQRWQAREKKHPHRVGKGTLTRFVWYCEPDCNKDKPEYARLSYGLFFLKRKGVKHYGTYRTTSTNHTTLETRLATILWRKKHGADEQETPSESAALQRDQSATT